jgi:hypothetical protein
MPYTWSASGLPGGLGINPNSGVISGTPAPGTAATYNNVIVTVKDSSASQQSTSATFMITILPASQNFLMITGGTVGQNLQIPIIVTLSPQSSGNPVQVSSNNPSVITLAEHSGDVGTGSLTIATSLGQTTFSVFAQGIASSGAAMLTASTTLFTSGTSTVTAAPSAFVLAGPNGIGGSFTSGQNASSQLTVSAAQLDSSGNVVQIQSVAGGQSAVVTLTLGDPNLGTVTPPSITFTGGMSNATTQFTAGSTQLSSTITASEPAGFSTPAGNANVLGVSVTNLMLSCAPVTVGQNLENFTTCSLSGGAPSDQTVTLTSNDPSKLLLSPDGIVAGSASITRLIRAGGSSTPPFYVIGLGNSGNATFGASTGVFNATGTVTLAKSGFVLVTPFGLGADFSATAGGTPIGLTVQTARLDASSNYVDTQALAAGLTANVTVTSSNTGVGTISGSPAVIAGTTNSATVQFQGVVPGTTVVTAVAPSGYSTPTSFATVNAMVGQPRILIDDGNSIGKNLQRQGIITLLGAPAPAGGLAVTLTASGPLSLSTTGTDNGTGTITVTIPAGQSSGTYYMYGLDSVGSGTVSATATGGFKSGSGTETLTASGIVIAGPGGQSGIVPFNTPLSSGDQPLTISAAQLDTGGNLIQTQALAGSASLVINLTNSTPGTGTIPSTVTIAPGFNADGTPKTATATFHPVAVGTTKSSVSQPAGFSTPTDGTNSVTINVQ